MTGWISNLATRLAGWPVVGPLVRVSVALIQLPDLRDRFRLLESQQIPAQDRRIDALGEVTDDIRDRLISEVSELRRLIGTSASSSWYPESDVHGRIERLLELVESNVGRIEFVRRELMYEMRYGAGEGPRESGSLAVEPQIISRDKLDAARSGTLRLNLGCGHVALDGYLNVDRRALEGVDIVAEVDDIPLDAGEVDEIFSSHLLEHFPEEHLVRKALPHWMNLLRDGGVFRAVVPDAEAMIRAYAAGDYPYSDLREVTFGAQDYDGDFHYNMFTPESLSRILVAAGFDEVTVLAEGRRNGACLEFEIQGRKGGLTAAPGG